MATQLRMTRAGDTGYQLGSLIADGLPKRQAEALLYTGNGFTDQQASELMNCAPATVKHLRKEVHFKCGSHTGPSLIVKCFENGFLRLACITLAWLIGLGAITTHSMPATASNTEQQEEEDDKMRFRNRSRRNPNTGRRLNNRARARTRQSFTIFRIHPPELAWENTTGTLLLEGQPLHTATEHSA
ncbi:hypothetical protein HBA55_34995 [Pseudomaricurvus alkylphenolicus]|uniref:helix-turn-helix transcriptional regulator n=1 Tax=Pseudomaricurvus alkylphenolicus TaxID=1306991 RepID=UPI0014232D20|nr:hypothetical protein [Pseudomaricurvus alkylphenolicus]NIB44841.1 hypothetical protein [Pseudomaricurvus alkylphenolicus]